MHVETQARLTDTFHWERQSGKFVRPGLHPLANGVVFTPDKNGIHS
jgi:hypothetical protein